jgi:large subunit ribosomal protein L47
MTRSFTATQTVAMPLAEFRDTVSRQKRTDESVGRSWSATELRRKNYEDLHKLWFVLYKERNMLLTEQQLSRRKGIMFPQPGRMRKVRKSMGAIKHVLGERKREMLARLAREKLEFKNKMDEDAVEEQA